MNSFGLRPAFNPSRAAIKMVANDLINPILNFTKFMAEIAKIFAKM